MAEVSDRTQKTAIVQLLNTSILSKFPQLSKEQRAFTVCSTSDQKHWGLQQVAAFSSICVPPPCSIPEARFHN